jgi:putative SOS response-associated peptidase YedK
LAELLEAFLLDEQDLPPFIPRYNIAPTQPVFAVREHPGGPKPSHEAVALRWGLIPSWASDASIGNRMINARAETLATKPAFRTALKKRRCLIAAEGFYEWKTEGKVKQPYFIHFRDDRPFAFAGLWDRWEGPDHSTIGSCTLITTSANELLRPLHDRMPVIVRREEYAEWLSPNEQDADALMPILQPYAGGDLEAFPVSRSVNSPSHDAADCLSPAT